MVNKKKKNLNFTNVLGFVIFIPSLIYLCLAFSYIKDNQLFHLINSVLLLLTTTSLILMCIKKDNFYKILMILSVSLVIGFNIFISLKPFDEKKNLIPNFTNWHINDVLKWGEENNIDIEQIYEFSDNINEFYIISQDISLNTKLKDVNKVSIIVSSGPNYNKIVIIPNLVGSFLEELLKIKEELKLNNIKIDFVISEEEKNIIIEQSLKGQYARNTEIVFKVSLGSGVFTPIEMKDLKNLDLFSAELWLKQNIIKYNITYEFNENIPKGRIINQNIDPGVKIESPEMNVELIVSKGNKIIVPNLFEMTSDEVTKWISDNNLKIEFGEQYHTTVKKGNIISANYKEGDTIESGTLIKIVTSKGQIIFPGFNSLAEFKTWANNYNVNYSENYQPSSIKAKGEIISFSHKEGDNIDPNDTINIIISTGNPITVPNFYNMNKSDITSKCKSLGLVCTFFESNYSNINAGNAINQNVNAGSTVPQGKTINIGLSKGPAKTFTVKISPATILSCNNDSNCTINVLKSSFSSNYPGVIFNFTTQASSVYDFAGNIHENSPIKDGVNVTQGNTYNVIITK